MNKDLIDNLYRQSLKEVFDYSAGDRSAGGYYSNYMTVLDHFKFAELIVRECARIALEEDHEPHECILAHFKLFEHN